MIYHYKMKQPDIINVNAGDGSRQSPWYWYGKTNGQTVDVNNSNTNEDNRRVYLRVKLLAGTTYYIGQSGPGGGDGKIWLYDQNYNELTYNDDWSGEIAGIYCYDHFEYTPSTTGIYIIGAGSYSSAQGNYTVAISPAPESDTVPDPQTIYYTSEGFDNWGKAIKYRSASLADCNNVIIPKEGLVFYAPLKENINQFVGGNPTIQSGNPVFQSFNNINCLKCNGNTRIDYEQTNDIPLGSNPRTMSCWVCSTVEHTSWNFICGFGSNDSNTFSFCTYQGYYRFYSTSLYYEISEVEKNNWKHLLVTYDNNELKYYCNGEYVGNTLNKNYNTSACGVYVGYLKTQNQFDYYGGITAFRIYNRVLTLKEINLLSNEFKI